MGAVNNYNIEFPRRTLKLLQSFRDKKVDYNLNVTFLMNCLLGLIVTAVENSERQQLMAGNVDNDLLNLLPDNVEIKVGNHPLATFPKARLLTRGKLSVLKKIRNGIAHQHVNPHNNGNNWIGVTIWNVNPGGEIDFRLSLTTQQLHSLATYIAEHYLQINN